MVLWSWELQTTVFVIDSCLWFVFCFVFVYMWRPVADFSRRPGRVGEGTFWLLMEGLVAKAQKRTQGGSVVVSGGYRRARGGCVDVTLLLSKW